MLSWEHTADTRTTFEGFFKAKLYFTDGSFLEFREYVNTRGVAVQKYSYSYHFQKGSELIFRYDNAPHHQSVATFPHHKHLHSGTVVAATEPDLDQVLQEIESLIHS
ncbi:MAG: DUF6516 family protein [Candidatus Poribacteria bacterium]|nr:DUF6516 family protein [Candidatus Poribacteria bacterium]